MIVLPYRIFNRALERTALDSTAVGDAREVLLDACQKFAIVGSPESVEERIAELRDARVETIVGYVADGIDTSYQ